jgi:hypothetical protein
MDKQSLSVYYCMLSFFHHDGCESPYACIEIQKE